MLDLKIYKTNPEVTLPKFGTSQSACFDLSYQPNGKYEYTGYSVYNGTFTRPIHAESGLLTIMPGDRVMVPTGLIFDIPEGYSVRIHPRSGLSYKQGLVLANLEAVIDSDYTQETFILLTNLSENPQVIRPGDRVAQAELVVQLKYEISETTVAPTQKTERIGGLGSTGVASITNPPVATRGPGRPKKTAA